MNWILFGFKGSGKTYFGKKLGLPFVDIDVLIEQREKMTVRNLIREKGELYFRNIERQIIGNLEIDHHIIATGGGSVLDQHNLIHLQALGKMIYLDCPKAQLKRRLLQPPLATFLDPHHPEDSFEKLYCTRILKYEKIPSYRLSLEGKTEHEVLEELWQVINLETSFGSPHGANPMVKQ